MSVSLKQCAASVKQMEAINSTLKQYGTRYLLPQSTEASCLYGYFCQATDCPHHSREYFNEILYPYEHYTVVDGLPEQEHMNLTESVKRICKYYGLFDLKGLPLTTIKPAVFLNICGMTIAQCFHANMTVLSVRLLSGTYSTRRRSW